MGRKVRKTLNIDIDKLKRAQEYLELDTETDVIDHLLDNCEFEREIEALHREFAPYLKNFRSPLMRRQPPHRRKRRK